MNAAIRAVVRVGIGEGCEVLGICNGYAGLVSGEIMQMGVRSVGGIIHLSGTVLGSARCPQFGGYRGDVAGRRPRWGDERGAPVVLQLTDRFVDVGQRAVR